MSLAGYKYSRTEVVARSRTIVFSVFEEVLVMQILRERALRREGMHGFKNCKWRAGNESSGLASRAHVLQIVGGEAEMLARPAN
jgi:hypothetical protein